MSYVVLSGTMDEGFIAYGPFDDKRSATDWATRNCSQEWFAMEMTDP